MIYWPCQKNTSAVFLHVDVSYVSLGVLIPEMLECDIPSIRAVFNTRYEPYLTRNQEAKCTRHHQAFLSNFAQSHPEYYNEAWRQRAEWSLELANCCRDPYQISYYVNHPNGMQAIKEHQRNCPANERAQQSGEPKQPQ
jgi:hypothetical protein